MGPRLNDIWNLDDRIRINALGRLIWDFSETHKDELADATDHHRCHDTVGFGNYEDHEWSWLVEASHALPVDPDGLWPVENQLVNLLHLHEAWVDMVEIDPDIAA